MWLVGVVGLCAIWFVTGGLSVAASLGLGLAHAVWRTLVLARSSLALLCASRVSSPGSSLQGACEA